MTVDSVQRVLAGRQRRVRRALAAVLRDVLDEGAPPATDEAERGMGRTERELIDAHRCHELALAWKRATGRTSSRGLGDLLRGRLGRRCGFRPSLARLQRTLDGRTRRVRRVVQEELEALVQEQVSDVRSALIGARQGSVEEDLEWVDSRELSRLADLWLRRHPDSSLRRLSIRVSEESRRFGFSMAASSIHPILSGRKKRGRGFLRRTLLFLLAERPGAGRPDADRERELVSRWRLGRDPEAAAEMVEAHRPWVAQQARRFSGYGIEHEDLVSEGCVGLIAALNRFDPDRGVRFLTYAGHWVRKYLFDYVMANHRGVAIRRGQPEARMFFSLRRRRAETGSDLAGLAGEYQTTPERLASFASWLAVPDLCLDARRPGEDWTPADRLADGGEGPESEATRADVRQRVRAACETLPRSQRLIMQRRWLDADGRRPTLESLGHQLGLSRERVRQLESEALERLRGRLGESGLAGLSPPPSARAAILPAAPAGR